jgi:hypothetical protein
MQPIGIQPIPVGYAPIIAAIIDRMGCVKRINDMVPATKNPCKLSHGLRTKALIINILTQRQALYRVEALYEKQDLELLFGERSTLTTSTMMPWGEPWMRSTRPGWIPFTMR